MLFRSGLSRPCRDRRTLALSVIERVRLEIVTGCEKPLKIATSHGSIAKDGTRLRDGHTKRKDQSPSGDVLRARRLSLSLHTALTARVTQNRLW